MFWGTWSQRSAQYRQKGDTRYRRGISVPILPSGNTIIPDIEGRYRRKYDTRRWGPILPARICLVWEGASPHPVPPRVDDNNPCRGCHLRTSHCHFTPPPPSGHLRIKVCAPSSTILHHLPAFCADSLHPANVTLHFSRLLFVDTSSTPYPCPQMPLCSRLKFPSITLFHRRSSTIHAVQNA